MALFILAEDLLHDQWRGLAEDVGGVETFLDHELTAERWGRCPGYWRERFLSLGGCVRVGAVVVILIGGDFREINILPVLVSWRRLA